MSNQTTQPLQAEFRDGHLIIAIPFHNATSPELLSSTGKSHILAQSAKFHPTTYQVEGKPVLVNVMAVRLVK